MELPFEKPLLSLLIQSSVVAGAESLYALGSARVLPPPIVNVQNTVAAGAMFINPLIAANAVAQAWGGGVEELQPAQANQPLNLNDVNIMPRMMLEVGLPAMFIGYNEFMIWLLKKEVETYYDASGAEYKKKEKIEAKDYILLCWLPQLTTLLSLSVMTGWVWRNQKISGAMARSILARSALLAINASAVTSSLYLSGLPEIVYPLS